MPEEHSLGRVVPDSYGQAKDGTAAAAALKHYDVLTAAYPEASCFVFRKSSTFRKACVYVSHSKAFENFIFFIILCNCVTLALSSSRQDFDATLLGQVIIKIDYAFLAVFTLEMILKIISMGFVLKKGTYLRDGWNVLDFLVVVVSYLGLIQAHNLTGLRTIRALRPLRAVRRIRGMQVLVTTMIGSLPMLFDVFMLCAFTFFMFGIVAVQLFAGALRNRCGTPDFSGAYNVTLASSSSSNTGVGGSGLDALAAGTVVLANVSYEVPDDQSEDMCSGPLSSEVMWYLSAGGKPVALPGKLYTGRHCNDGMYCAPYGNPYDGFVSYDNILWSWLTIFQHITLSGWTDVMYMVMDAVNYWVWIFYMGLIIFGAFFMINLALAVLSVNFSSDNLKQLAEEEQPRAALVDAGGAGEEEARTGGNPPGLGGYLLAPVSISNVMAQLRARKLRQDDEDDPTVAIGSPPPPSLGRLRRFAWRLAVSKGLELTTAALIVVNIAVMCVNWYGMPYKAARATDYMNYALTGYFVVELIIRITAFGFAKFFRVGMNIFDTVVVLVSLVEMIIDLVPSMSGLGPLSVLRAFRLLRIFRLARNWKEFNALIRGMFNSVQASIMLVGLMLLFLFISSLVGMELFGYEFMFCDYVEGARAVCPPGQRVWGDCPNHFYCYLPCSDSQNGTWVDAPGSFYNGLAYCERFCASAEGGGCEYLAMVGKSQVPRANFDNVLWGIYTVFQVLTGEDWNDIMYNGMRTVSKWASLYFVASILIGNYLVFNLFIAILLDNLSFKIEEAASNDAKLKGSDYSSESSSHNREGKDEEAEEEEKRPPVVAGKQSLEAAAPAGGSDGGGASVPAPAPIAGGGAAVGEEMKPAGESRTSLQTDWGQAGGKGDDNNGPVNVHQLQSTGKGSSDQRPPDGSHDAVTVAVSRAISNRHDRRPLLPPLPPRSKGPETNSPDNGAVQGNVLSRPSAVAEAYELPSHQPSPRLQSPEGDEKGRTITMKAQNSARSLLPAFQLAASGTKLRWDDSTMVPSSMTAAAAPAASAADYPYTNEMLMSTHSEDKGRVGEKSKEKQKSTESKVSDMTASRATSKATLDLLAHEATTASWQQRGRDVSVSRIPRNSSKSVLAHLKSLGSFAAGHPMRPPWQNALEGRALFLFGPESGLRSATATLVHNKFFEMTVMVLILASCVCLVLDVPGLDPESKMSRALRILDYIFTGAFTLEAILKIVTFGFAFTGKHAYIRSGWNVLDLFIVLLGWTLIIVEEVGVSARGLTVMRVLRALRALRPLRVVHRFPGLRMVVSALLAVLPSMINVALVCAFFYLIFAILAVNLFKGKLFNCIDAASGERIDPYYVLPPGQVLTRSWCEAGNQTISQSVYYSRINVTMPEYTMLTQWVNPANNFDNVGVAMLTLFQAATLSMWVDITFSAVDAVGVDKQPLWNHSPWVILIFILFIVVCSFFVLNLFIGVTLEKFAELHEAEQGTISLDLTPEQQTWIDVQKLLIRTRMQYKPPRPRNRLRGVIYVVVSHNLFDLFMLVVIICNVAFMAMVHWGMSSTWQDVMSYSNLTFTSIFVVEALAKIVAFGPLGYFRDGWNCFDFIVVLASVASVVLDYSNTRNVSFMPVLRVLRVARVATGMQKLLRTLLDSLPALANVGGAMLLFFFIFAVIGVNLFAGIKYGDNLNPHANFDNFPNAMLLLFRMITGEGWNAIMLDCMQTHDCIMVLEDINITTTASTTTATTSPPASAASDLSPPLATIVSTVVPLLAGTYLDRSDPLLSSLPSNATQNQCPLSPIAAVVYFPVFVVLCTFILLQLVIGVLLENLTQAESDAELPISKACVDSFVEAWSNLDGTATGFIHASQLVSVVCLTEPPLGTAGRFNSWVEAQERLLQMDIPLYEGNQVSFIEVLYSLSGAVCGAALPEAAETKLVDELSKGAPHMEPWEDHTAGHYHAAISVAAAIRGFLLRHAYRDLLKSPVSGADPLGTTAVAALAATRFRSRAVTTGAADSDMLVNGHRLSDLRRELAADNINNSVAVRRPRPGVLTRLPPIAPLRAHRGPDPAGLLSARALHSPMSSEGKKDKLSSSPGVRRPASPMGQWVPGTPAASRSSGRLGSLPPMRPRSSSGQQQQQQQHQGEPLSPPSGHPLTAGPAERRPDRVSSAPVPAAAADPNPVQGLDPAEETAAAAAAAKAAPKPASSMTPSSVPSSLSGAAPAPVASSMTAQSPPHNLGPAFPSVSGSQQLRHSVDEIPRRKVILPSLAGYSSRSVSAGKVAGMDAGAGPKAS